MNESQYPIIELIYDSNKCSITPWNKITSANIGEIRNYEFKSLQGNIITDILVNGNSIGTTDKYSLKILDKIKYTIEVTTSTKTIKILSKSNDESLGTTHGDKEVSPGVVVSLTATPKVGCKFDKWITDDREILNINPIKVKSFDDVTYKAVFSKIIHNIIITPNIQDSCDIVCNNTEIDEFTEFSAIIKPRDGYEFCYWNINDSEIKFDTTIKLNNIKSDILLVPILKKLSHKVFIKQIPNCTLSCSSTEVEHDSPIELSAKVNEGYIFKRWINEYGDTFSNNSDLIYRVTKDISLSAEIGIKRFNVKVSHIKDSEIIKSYSYNLKYNTLLNLSGLNIEGYHLEKVINGNNIITDPIYVTEDLELKVIYSKNTYNINLLSNINESIQDQFYCSNYYPKYNEVIKIGAIEYIKDYVFLYWKLDDEIVSLDRVFNYTVGTNNNLIAHYDNRINIAKYYTNSLKPNKIDINPGESIRLSFNEIKENLIKDNNGENSQ